MHASFSPSIEYAAALDAADPLRSFRSRFVHDDSGLIYLDGNSLGRLPLVAADALTDLVTRQWGSRLIRSWNESWFDLPERLGDKLARLLGAQPGEIVIADSTSVNLFKLVVAALRARPGRTRILTDDLNFPSDYYILQGAIDLLGDAHTLEIIRAQDGIHGPAEAIAAALDDRVALVTLSHTVFKSAYTYDMAALNAAAHAAGALVLWDLSHSAGSVPVDLTESDADLAVGCTYKYLNGGPGAAAFLYIRHDLQPHLRNPITGWMGQTNPFDFGEQSHPLPGIRGFLSGTPSVLAMTAIENGVDLLLEAGMPALRAKSLAMTDYFIQLWRTQLEPVGFRLNAPLDARRRGSHISLGHADAWRIDQALIAEMNVLPDFRQPDNIRLGFAPLYNSFTDLHTAAAALRRIVDDRLYEKYAASATAVT